MFTRPTTPPNGLAQVVTARLAAIAFAAAASLIVVGCSSSSNSSDNHAGQAAQSVSASQPAQGSGNGESVGVQSESDEPITRQEAIDEHWDDIKDDLSGSATIDACSDESGSCYSLDADIDDGSITTVHFNNGGYLNVNADIDSSGDASDTDQDGHSWTFTLDMDSSIVDDAIKEWADRQGYSVE